MNLVGTGMFAFVGFSFPTSKLLPTSYYKITNKRLVTKIYDFWGVKYFRFFLLLTFWKSKEKQKTFFNGTKEGLRQFTFALNQAEFGHLGAFIFIQIYGIAMFLKGEFLVFMILSIINIIFNLYPIILQRKHRVRIQGILER